MPGIAPAETDLAAGESDKPAVGDRDTVRVAPEIGQHSRGTGKWALGVDDPLDPPQRGQAPDEHGRVGKSGERAEEAELSGLERRPELLQKQPPEQPRQHRHRQEKAGSAGDPARAVRGQAATRDKAMNSCVDWPAPGGAPYLSCFERFEYLVSNGSGAARERR